MRQIFAGALYIMTILGPQSLFASSEAELHCQETALRLGFLKGDSEAVCENAKNEGPALCAHKAYETYFSKEQSIELCQRGAIENANCAINAYQDLLYSTDQAVQAFKEN